MSRYVLKDFTAGRPHGLNPAQVCGALGVSRDALLKKWQPRLRKEPSVADGTAVAPGVTLDREEHLERVKRYLPEAPLGIPGRSVNTTTREVAYRCGSLGVSQQVALELMKRIYVPRYREAGLRFTESELPGIVENAYRYHDAVPLGSLAISDAFLDLAKQRPADDIETVTRQQAEDEEAKAEREVEADVEQRLERMLAGAFTADSFDPAKTQPRRLLLGDTALVGTLSQHAAAGGGGKTQIALLRAYSLASGKALSGERVHEGAKVVVVLNLEDPRNEIEMRLAAIERTHGVPRPRNLIILTRRELGRDCRLAYDHAGNAVVNEAAVEALRRFLKAKKVDALWLDPFVKIHTFDENSNSKINFVVDLLADLAAEHDIPVLLCHHIGKQAAAAKVIVGASRGASSLVDGVRNNEVSHRATADEVKDILKALPEFYKIAGPDNYEPWRFIYLTSDKVNFVPPISSRRWFYLKTVNLANGCSSSCVIPFEVPPETIEGSPAEYLREVAEGLYSEGLLDDDMRAQRSLHYVANHLAETHSKKTRQAYEKEIAKAIKSEKGLRLADGTHVTLKTVKGRKTLIFNFRDYGL